MTAPPPRRAATTRRAALAAGGAVLALGAAGAWLSWDRNADALAALSRRPDAPALRALGQAYLKTTPLSQSDVAARLKTRLTGDLADAMAADRAAGRLVPVDGWLIGESQALAGAWLALTQPG